MKLAFVELNGFRGYRKPMRIEFGSRFTIIDGRNGVGKSTIFDAIEYALTGAMSKYNDAKASGESFADYVWWTGDGPAPAERYVEVGFTDGDKTVTVRREEFEGLSDTISKELLEKLCDTKIAPTMPLLQLSASTIIRDEHITSLSLDLKETDRYALLRDALGANDSDAWMERGAKITSLAKRRVEACQQEVAIANADLAVATRRLDEVRSSLVADAVIKDVVERLRTFANTVAAADQLAAPVRERMGTLEGEIQQLQDITNRWRAVDGERLRLDSLKSVVEAARAVKQSALVALQAIPPALEGGAASALAQDATNLISLVALGKQVGLRDGNCPLCAKGQSHDEFEHGMQVAEAIARRINEKAARAAELEEKRRVAEIRLAAATRTLESAEVAHAVARKGIDDFDIQRRSLKIEDGSSLEAVTARLSAARQVLEGAQKDFRILETLRLNPDLERVQRTEGDAKARLARAQERFGRARKAETAAHALYDAARRAASETLDRRLERVLPLMSELYRRLRPHPVWTDIEYSIRGDVRRFLKLQVGDHLNPQFLFSSGQRRATGLAFLLSINLSLAWSRWRSILLDDPVQHVDDFRTVHLAELAAQLVIEGRQVICAVEDAALADLLCRRLPIEATNAAKRVTLGVDGEGALTKVAERWLTPHARNSVLSKPEQLAAG